MLMQCVRRIVPLALVVMLGRGGPALAAPQLQLPPGFDEAFEADFNPRDLVLIEEGLNLDEGQRAIIATLFADYQRAFQEGVEAVRAELAPLQPLAGQPDPEVERKREELRERLSEVLEEARTPLEELPPGTTLEQFQERLQREMDAIRAEMEALRPRLMTEQEIQALLDQAGVRIEAWNRQKRGLREALIADLQAVMHEEQRLRWPPLERKLARLRSLPQGRLQGESVDLIQIFDSLKLEAPAPPAAADALDDYSIRLDTALKQREELLAESQRELIEAMQSQGGATGDAAAAQRARAILERQMQARVAVRNVNDQLAPAIAGALPEEAAARFMDEFRMRGYPRVYRSTVTTRLIKSARELPGLSAEAQQALAELERSYQAELAATNEQLLQVVRQHEPAELIAAAQRAGRGAGRAASEGDVEGDEPPPARDPIKEAFARRNELGERYTAQLRALLTAEQFETLPRGGAERPARDGAGGG